jgi:hypothetical protein
MIRYGARTQCEGNGWLKNWSEGDTTDFLGARSRTPKAVHAQAKNALRGVRQRCAEGQEQAECVLEMLLRPVRLPVMSGSTGPSGAKDDQVDYDTEIRGGHRSAVPALSSPSWDGPNSVCRCRTPSPDRCALGGPMVGSRRVSSVRARIADTTSGGRARSRCGSNECCPIG